MTRKKPLQWSADEGGKVLGLPMCDVCTYKMLEPGMAEACASVGIEHGKSTGQMMRDYIDSFHARGHLEDSDEILVDMKC